ncbi:MAG: hypothetical protein LH679_23425 [Cyanobacteria bacterium CAN_BIN43]|nr:hypothetical protein [Cyanobacteria bacterium CAN_BIN43]
MGSILQMQREGSTITPEVVAHPSPDRYKHINPHSRYLFDFHLQVKRTGLRNLCSDWISALALFLV